MKTKNLSKRHLLVSTEAYRGLKNWLGLKFDYKQSEKKSINNESVKGH